MDEGLSIPIINIYAGCSYLRGRGWFRSSVHWGASVEGKAGVGPARPEELG